jgi:hypothetical protein
MRWLYNTHLPIDEAMIWLRDRGKFICWCERPRGDDGGQCDRCGKLISIEGRRRVRDQTR